MLSSSPKYFIHTDIFPFSRIYGFKLCGEDLNLGLHLWVLQHYFKFHFCNMSHHHFLRKLPCMKQPQALIYVLRCNSLQEIFHSALYHTCSGLIHTENNVSVWSCKYCIYSKFLFIWGLGRFMAYILSQICCWKSLPWIQQVQKAPEIHLMKRWRQDHKHYKHTLHIYCLGHKWIQFQFKLKSNLALPSLNCVACMFTGSRSELCWTHQEGSKLSPLKCLQVAHTPFNVEETEKCLKF